MRKLTFSLAALAISAMPAMADVYDNGGMDPQPGGCGGEMYSQIESPGTIYGNNTIVGFFHQADDFVVPQGESWELCELTWYLYQTGSPNNEPITAVYIQIWNGSPTGGASIIYGDMTTNRLTSSNFSGIYRVSTGVTDCQRAIKEVKVDMTWVGAALGPGHYYIEIGSEGNPSYSGPWANHKVPRDLANDNSEYYTVSSGVWQINADANGGGIPWDYPFKLEYNCGGGGFTLDVNTSCPNSGPATLTASGGSGGNVGFIYSNRTGNFMIPNNYNTCPGTVLGLGGTPTLLGTARGNPAVFRANAPAAACRRVFIQALDIGPCNPSNVVRFE